MEIISVNKVSFKYPDQTEKVLDQVSLSVKEGEFAVICGPSGCGKTTLLRLLKKELSPVGSKTGEIIYNGQSLEDWDERTLIEQIGLVMQDPDNQIVMDEVMQEIVFALENLGYSNFEMRKRVAELVHFFGIEGLLRKKPSELSGGQKQMINLLSVLLLKPRILLLDEPTSQLDPIATRELIMMLDRLNKEMGLTIIIIEHQLEELFAVADKVYIMESGRIVREGNSKKLIYSLYEQGDEWSIAYVPTISRLYMEVDGSPQIEKIPLTVKEGREWIASEKREKRDFRQEIKKNEMEKSTPLLHIKDVYYQYEKNRPYILKSFSFQIQKGEFVALVGGNGSGKTTALKVCIGSLKPQRGHVRINGKDAHKLKGKALYNKLAYLPQNPRAYFVHNTIDKEMKEAAKRYEIEDAGEVITELLDVFGIGHLRFRHPHDCSGGEIQRAALACMLIGNPELLFIDEPTKGLDPYSKKRFSEVLHKLHKKGMTIIMVTHDIEFAARTANRCAMMFDGEITVDGTPNQLFKGNYFYTTTINRITRLSQVNEVLTLEEAIQTWPVHVNI